MDALLSHAFDNISSKDVGRIRKGLRQIEGLLAQICLSAAPSRRPAQEQHRRGHARQRSTVAAHAASEPKRLADVGADLAFREFYRLQDGFEWNGRSLIAPPRRQTSVSGTDRPLGSLD